MASFDMITAAGNAYVKTWEERAYLGRMILIPLLLKFICYSVAVIYIGTEDIIRLSIIMLPAYFVEGWFLSHWVRTIMFGHRWPFRPSGNDKKDAQELEERGRGILGGTLAFVLINFLMAGYFAFFTSFIPPTLDPQAANSNMATMGALMMFSTIILFRFVWLYIPLSANISWQYYVKKLNRVSFTFWLIGLWLVCFVPCMMVMQLGGNLLKGVEVGGEGAQLAQSGLVFLRVITDSIKNVLCTAGITYAIMDALKLKAIK